MNHTPSTTELVNIGFKPSDDSSNISYVYELEIKECGDKLLLRQAYDGGWFWSIRNTDNEPINCQSIKRMSQVFNLIDILKGI